MKTTYLKYTKGNALFLILIAVALFAALAYAVTQTSRGTGNADKEDLRLIASEIIQWGAQAQAQAQRMRIIDGIDEYSFSFRAPANGYSSDTGLYNCPTTGEQPCQFFRKGTGTLTNGSGIEPPRDYPAKYLYSTYSHINPTPYVMHIQGVGTGSSELVYAFVGLSRALCEEINRLLQISPTWPVTEPSGAFAAYNSTNVTLAPLSFGDLAPGVGDNNAGLVGQSAFCYRDAATPNLGRFVQVLVPR